MIYNHMDLLTLIFVTNRSLSHILVVQTMLKKLWHVSEVKRKVKHMSHSELTKYKPWFMATGELRVSFEEKIAMS